MGTQGVGTFLINSKFASGSLVFYEKAVGRTATGDVLTIGTAAVKVGGTAQDVDFQVYGTGSVSAIIDIGAATFTLVGIATATNGAVTITNATATTSATTGALIVTGGIATAAALWVGTTSRLVGAVTCNAAVTMASTLVVTTSVDCGASCEANAYTVGGTAGITQTYATTVTGIVVVGGIVTGVTGT